MSEDARWDVDSYREDYESDEQWELRRAFLLKWKNDYSEERLLCLAQIFINMEFMGCRYPSEVMKEVAGLSEEIVKPYRANRVNKLKRTFVSASDAAEDRARGVKREAGKVVDSTPNKTARIAFVKQGINGDQPSTSTAISQNGANSESDSSNSDDEPLKKKTETLRPETLRSETLRPETLRPETLRTETLQSETLRSEETVTSETKDVNEYFKELSKLRTVDVRKFKESLFETEYGNFVLIIRPWVTKLGNIKASCLACKLENTVTYDNGVCTLSINKNVVAQASGETRQESRNNMEIMAWNRLKQDCCSILVKEQWIARGDARITAGDVSRKTDDKQFGEPVQSSVAAKMMKMMGWAGGGLGADAQGIEEPIKPHLQMVNRAGLGSDVNVRSLRQSGADLMRRYRNSDALDVDLVFSSEFSKEERAILHQIAKKFALASNSYGKDEDRFLVVKKKMNPFNLIKEVINKGGNTPKYQAFIPLSLYKRKS